MAKNNKRERQNRNSFKNKHKLIKLDLLLMIIVCFLSFIIPLRLVMARYQQPEPQRILVLGGNKKRFEFAAQFSHSHPDLDILVSASYSKFEQNRTTFQEEGVSAQKIHYDFCPTDTVTNFTCSIDYFKKNNVKHIYLITSDYHMRRSRAIGSLILGSRGIVMTPISVPHKIQRQESNIKIIRDIIRSFVWILTGRSGSSFKADFE